MNINYQNPKWIKVYRDRFDAMYQNTLVELLKVQNLKDTAEIASRNALNGDDPKRITIKFSGLSSLSLLGGTEKDNLISNQFKNLLSCTREIEETDNYLDIQFLFSYPYSDFNYNLVLSEVSRQEGDTVECLIKKKRYTFNYHTPEKLTQKNLLESVTYKNLKDSLIKLQDYIIEANKSGPKPVFNTLGCKHKITIKFSTLNIMTCFLKINNHVFIDPYTYSKDNSHCKTLNLSSPLTHIILDDFEKWSQLDTSNNDQKDEEVKYESHKNHFFSLVGHFRYLWHHPLTLAAFDATLVTKNNIETLSKIKTPYSIDFFGKARMISEKLEKMKDKSEIKENEIANEAEIDTWLQYVRAEFLKSSSKFSFQDSKEIIRTSPKIIKLKEIPIFIVGSWKKGDLNNYMKIVKDFFEDPILYTDELQNKVAKEFNFEKYINYFLIISKLQTHNPEYSYRKKVKLLFNQILQKYFNLIDKNTVLIEKCCKKLAQIIRDILSESSNDYPKVLETLKGLFYNDIALNIIECMKQTDELKHDKLQTFIMENWFPKSKTNKEEKKVDSPTGLKFKPVLIDADDAEDITKSIYKNLNESQLGFVIQTNDLQDRLYLDSIKNNLISQKTNASWKKFGENSISDLIKDIAEIIRNDYFSKPNVYLEKGFLMGKLGKRLSRHGKMIEAVCVFSEVNSHKESNNNHIANTIFVNRNEFEIELYRAIKWIWNITSMNSVYSNFILLNFQKVIEFKEKCQELHGLLDDLNSQSKNEYLEELMRFLMSTEDIKISFHRHSYKISNYINDIQNWVNDFDDRYNLNLGKE